MPVILGFDTATADTAVAVSGPAGGERLLGPAGGRPVHGSALLGAIEGVVAETGGWGAIGLIAVGVGPGSFTGLRIGIATARALAQSRDLPIVGVPSGTALLAAIADRPAARGRRALAVLDARRGEVFAALGGEEGSDAPVVCAPGALASELGPAVLAEAIAGGEGALRFRTEIEAAGAAVLPARDPAHRLSARRICDLAANMDPQEREQVRPLYLRAPDAERWQQRDGRN